MFDTYAAAKALRDAGFDEPQAEAAVAMVRDAVSEGAATKEDATRLEGKIDAGIARLEGKIESDIGRLEGKIESDIAEVKADIGRLEGKIESDIGRLEGKIDTGRAETKADITRLETRLTVRMYGGLVAMAAVLLALTKLLP